jgi:hypothetical protein
MLPVNHQCVRDALVQLHTSHQDIRTDLPDTTAAEPTTTTVPTPTTAPLTNTARTHAPLLAIRKHFRHARTRIATLSTDIRHSPVLSWAQQRANQIYQKANNQHARTLEWIVKLHPWIRGRSRRRSRPDFSYLKRRGRT